MEPKHFSFLLLPPEIRHHIYNELLTTRPKDSPNEPVLLWHDRDGRARSISLYPEIMRVSKQINAEATPVLYERNKFWLDLTTPVGRSCVQPEKLPRSQALVQDDPSIYNYWEQPGPISPLCLQRLANIEIVISADSVWSHAFSSMSWSGTGNLFMVLLRMLAEPEDGKRAPKTKTLSITVKKSTFNSFGSVLFPPSQADECRYNRTTTGEKQMVDKVCPLIEAVGEKRNVYMYEVLKETIPNLSSCERWKTRTTTQQVSLKEFEDL
ncbi:MAG: hypothetical protein Q9213_000813 [Squamulea squamosa]